MGRIGPGVPSVKRTRREQRREHLLAPLWSHMLLMLQHAQTRVSAAAAPSSRQGTRGTGRTYRDGYTTKGLLIALTCLLASACASTPKSYMLVPSRTTVPEVEKLSRQSGTTVDVLTVNREERRFRLDSGDGAVLTGHDLDVAPQAAGANPVVRTPTVFITSVMPCADCEYVLT